MAVGNYKCPPLAPVAGIRLGTTSAGIKTPGRQDVVVIELDQRSHTAAVFTRNAFCAAPVQIARSHLAASEPRYLLVNTGNANAGTGEQGLADAQACVDQLASLVGVNSQQVLPFSTGVIGEPLPVSTIVDALPTAIDGLDENGWLAAAGGILTTDTRAKGASRTVPLDGAEAVITGIAKGSGMIRPDMATMLAYVATDAAIEPVLLQDMLNRAVEASFHRITVDGDTSTNDACVLVATGCGDCRPVTSVDTEQRGLFYQALESLMVELAQEIVRDAEGASKMVEICVEGGRDQRETLDVAFTVGHSPLVKTALFASDPNWGRLLAAVGRAGLNKMDVELVSIHIGDLLVAEKGARAASYQENLVAEEMAKEEVTIRIGLGRGDASSSIWTSDLSYDYVRINAEYRT